MLGGELSLAFAKQLQGRIFATRDEQRIQNLTVFLNELRIVINYLSKASQIDEDIKLMDYAEKTLGRPCCSSLIPEIKLKHVKHVWLLVKYEQTHQMRLCGHVSKSMFQHYGFKSINILKTN